MKWKNDPSEEALVKSGNNDGYGSNTSREANNNSKWEVNHIDNREIMAPSNQLGQPRRRRRISEMNDKRKQEYNRRDGQIRSSGTGNNTYDRHRNSEYAYSSNPQQEKQEQNFYKEKYNEVRESYRMQSDSGKEHSYNEKWANDTMTEQTPNHYKSRRPRITNTQNHFDGRFTNQNERRDNSYDDRRSNYTSTRKNPPSRYNEKYRGKSNSSEGLNLTNRREKDNNREYKKYDNRTSNKRNERSRGRIAPIYDSQVFNPNEEIRLNKFLANSGVCSRREADELIKAGAVIVNGIPVTELGVKITLEDIVQVNGKEIKPENKVYILLNKPRNCVTTTDDPQERLTVMHLVRKACNERIYPVGRLDRNTTGVLLLTNDGELASKLVHPSFKKKKIYHVWLDKEVAIEDMQAIANGIQLEDGEMHADAISYASEEDHSQVGIEIHSGRNRIVRRIFEHLGYHVTKLDRVYFAGLTKKNLGRGKWRYLTQEEVNSLKMGAFE